MLGNSNLAVIAFDPGHTTGVCLGEGINLLDHSFTVTYSNELPWEARSHIQFALQRLKKLEDESRLYLTAIVVEDFKLFASGAQAQVGSRFPSVAVIERIRVYSELLGLEDRIVMLEPSVKGRVKILPQHTASLLMRSEHAKDSYQLLRYYVLRKRAKR